MDWENLAKSPIWDTKTGFGGNGNKSAETSVAYGHCVTDGPFANLKVLYFADKFEPHCLSRGFQSGERLARLFGSHVRPEALEVVLQAADYDTFNMALEKGPHDGVVKSVRGDLARKTAPNGMCFQNHVLLSVIP